MRKATIIATIYGLALLVATVAIVHAGSSFNYNILLVLLPLIYGVIGAVAAVLFLPIRISWIGVVGFALFYTVGCILFIVALMPIVPMELVQTISSGLVVLLLATGVVFLGLARGCLLKFSQTTPPNAPRRALWTPALAISFAAVTALAPAMFDGHSGDHRHVVGHAPPTPELEVYLLWTTPVFILVLCHDFMFRRALDYLFWGRSFVDEDSLVLGLVHTCLVIGGIIVLSFKFLVP